MTGLQWLGVALLTVPLAVVAAAHILTIGLRDTLLVWGIVLALLALIFVGGGLLTGDLS